MLLLFVMGVSKLNIRKRKELMQQMPLEELPYPYYDIALELGTEAAAEILNMFGGLQIYFADFNKVTGNYRRQRIIEESNGFNHKELARKYGYTVRWIYKVLESERNDS